MGALVGPGINTPLIMATKKQKTAALTNRPERWRANEPLPMDAVEERLVPDERKYCEASCEGEEVLRGLARKVVAKIGGGDGQAGDPPEVNLEREQQEQAGAEPAEQNEQSQNADVTHVRDALLTRAGRWCSGDE